MKSIEQEPVAWTDGPHLVMRTDWRDRANYKGPWVDIGRAIPDSWVPVLYTAPPQRTVDEGEDKKTWVGLTDDEIDKYLDEQWVGYSGYYDCFKEVMCWQETKLKEKNA